MISFLFWNTRKKPLQSIISNIAHSYDIDVIMIAEPSIPPGELLNLLNSQGKAEYFYINNINFDKIDIFTRFPNEFIKTIYEESRFTIKKLCLPGLKEILLVIAHYPSKVHWDDESQSLYCTEVRNAIEKYEILENHFRTVLVGDLNMNPFESGIVGALGLHGVSNKKVAEKQQRIILEKQYRYFYNPMWKFFGDNPNNPPGTYYYYKSVPLNYFWNIFDQVLIRPDLLDSFELEQLEILVSDGKGNSLLDVNGLPDEETKSDHLPILFRLSL